MNPETGIIIEWAILVLIGLIGIALIAIITEQ